MLSQIKQTGKFYVAAVFMGELNDLINKVNNIDVAIENALRTEVAEAVRNAIVESARVNVYQVYTPKFENRRNGNGGILDTRSIRIEVHGNEIIAQDIAEWQQLYGGTKPSSLLAEAIANGDKRFHMQNAGPRPFHEKAKEILLSSGLVEESLKRGLERQGIDTSGMTFKFS